MHNNEIIENFDFNHINSTSISFDTAKEYLLKYITPLSNGNHKILHKDGSFIIKKKVLISVYLNRIPKDLKEFYLKTY